MIPIMTSADGVDVNVKWRYGGQKTIKYIIFSVVPYNAVRDIVFSSIGRKSLAQLEITGPIDASSRFRDPTWEAVWYNSTVRCIKLKKVSIEYMDGSKYIYIYLCQ